MKKVMMVGRVGCGKTTLCQRLFQQELTYKKTQAIELVGGAAIDTPGEYVENRSFYRALLVSAVEADVILLLQSCVDRESRFAPGMASMFQKPVIGVVTKVDLSRGEEDLDRARAILSLAGAATIILLSSTTGEGVETLLEKLEETP